MTIGNHNIGLKLVRGENVGKRVDVRIEFYQNGEFFKDQEFTTIAAAKRRKLELEDFYTRNPDTTL
jgi:hypothetical protein